MLWAILSVTSGFTQTLQQAHSKKNLINKQYSDWTVMLARFLYVTPLFLLIWVLEGIPLHIPSVATFSLIMASLVVLEVISQWFFHQSIKCTPLSITTPFQNLTPIFIVPISYLLLGRLPSPLGFAGICLTIAGLFFLRMEKNKKRGETRGWRTYLFSLLKNQGVQYMIVTAILWAGTTTLQKFGAELAGVGFFGICYSGGVTFLMIFYHKVMGISLKPLFNASAKLLIPIGFYAGFSSFAQYVALTLTHPSYVNALKRTANAFNLLWDKTFFEESVDYLRITANILTIAGSILILLA